MSLFGRKKEVSDEAGMSKLDNLGPVRSIVEELSVKNPKAHRLCVRALGKRQTNLRCTHHHIPAHTLAAFPSDWDGDLSLDYHTPLPYRSTPPRFLIPPRHLDVADPVTRLLATKQSFISNFHQMIGVTHHTKKLEGYKRVSAEVSVCPQHFVNMAAALAADPAPHFRAHYNWHYAGRGSLHTIALPSKQYLVHAELMCLHVSALGPDALTPDLEETFTFHTGENILEVSCREKDALVALRTLRKAILLKLTERGDSLRTHVLETFPSDVAYTSVEFDDHHDVLYLARLDDTVEIVNLDTARFCDVRLSAAPAPLDNWSAMLGLDRLHALHVTADAVRVFDKRTRSVAYALPSHRRLCEDCNDITVARPSRRIPHALYVATNHHAWCADVRRLRGLRPAYLARWTHGLRCPPTLLALEDFGVGREALVVASQWPEDLAVLACDAPHARAGLPPARSWAPYHPPDAFESLRRAHAVKLCLDPTLELERRLATAVTGLLVRRRDDAYEVATHNALGDLAVRTLYPEHHAERVREDYSEELSAWSEGLRRAGAGRARATELADVSRVWAFRRSVAAGRAPHRARDGAADRRADVDKLLESPHFDRQLLDAWNVE